MDQEQAKKAIKEMAVEAAEKSGVLDEQKQVLWEMVRTQKEIIEALASMAFEELSYACLYQVRHATKSEILYADKTPPNHSKRTPDVAMSARSLLDAYLCGGKPIGDCTKEEILVQAEWHESVHLAHSIRSKIFAAVAAKVKENKTARECISDKQFKTILDSFRPRTGTKVAS